MRFANKQVMVDYEVEMDNGYGVEGTSDTLSVLFNADGEIIEAILMGMHDMQETEFELDFDGTDAEILEILNKAKV